MNKIETKYAARHKPTGHWAYFWYDALGTCYVHLLTDFYSDCLYKKECECGADLALAHWNESSTGYPKVNKEDFEIVKIHVEYSAKPLDESKKL